MSYRKVLFYLGQILKIMSAFMLLPVITGLCYREISHIHPFLITAAIYFLSGFLITRFFKPVNYTLKNKEGLAIVGLSWIVISAIGALPFVIDGCIPNYIDAFFETVSGFTTTGCTILTDISSLPKSMLFWRSFTHWLGGMGILVFILAVMPSTDGSTYQLFKFESPGPQVGKLVSKVRLTATILYIIYLVMTAVEIVLLLFGGIGLFNSVIIALGTAGTGGFAASGLSIGEFNSVYVEVVVAAFMFLFGVNFNVYYLIILKHLKAAFADEELRFYFIYVALAIVAVTINLISYYENFASALRYASFTVISIVSSTGFAIADFTLWPQFSQMILMLCMFIGSCAGSTGGGFKVSRVLILIKSGYSHILSVLRPHSIQVVKLNKKMLSADMVSSVDRYLILYGEILVFSLLALSLNGFDFLTNFSATLTCFNNIGPGFGTLIGPYGSFAVFAWWGKLLLSLLMLMGRLEIFPILLLMIPKTWEKHF